jgi:dienelactone hydrolase
MMNRRQILLAALAAATLPLRADEVFDTLDLDWRDESRQRAVPVRLYRPRAEGSHPLVVFSHGIGGSRLGYGYLGRFLAAGGIASLHLQHVGSDRAVWTGGSIFGVVGRLQAAAQDAEAIARVLDLRFALDQLLDDPLGSGIDRQRIAAAGHSYGANTVLLAAGAAVQRPGAPPLREPRLKAAIAISAPPFYGETDLRAILGGISLPSLHITTTDDVIRVPGYYSAPEDRLAVFDATGGAKCFAQFNQGRHSTFVGRGGEADPVLAATRELALAFLRQVFDGDALALRSFPQRHAGLLARFVTA